MALPPVPESPRELPRKSQETPRVGMHLFHETEDDDVSVLTFNTLNTREKTSSYVRTARESLERMILESKNSGDNDCNVLSRISEEEVASQNTSCKSKTGCDRSTSSKSSLKSEANEETDGISSDDGTISMSESILDSANKVLSSIGSSPYYTGRNKKESSETHESPAPRPQSKHPSPMKRPTKMSDAKEDEKENCTRNIHGMEKEVLSSKESTSDKYSQLEVSSNFLNSYFRDDNNEPSDTNTDKSKYTIATNSTKVGNVDNEHNALDSYFCHEYRKPSDDDNSKSKNTFATNTTKVGNAENEQHLQKLESETRRLQLLLKERQLETRRANQVLLLSIKEANELLDRISVDRE